MTFSDKYDAPIFYTQKNTTRLNLKDRSTIIKSDMFNNIPKDKKFDAIVSNPPYIPENELKSGHDKELGESEINTFNNWLARRLEMEPIQYITGETEFWSLPIYVGPGVLIPRQDTETLVSEVKDHFKDKNKNYNFLDIGCG